MSNPTDKILDDKAMALLALSGQEEDASTFVARYQVPVLQHLLAKFGKSSDSRLPQVCDDITQDVMGDAFGKDGLIARWRGGSLEGYLRTVARFKMLTWIKKNPPPASSGAQSGESAEDWMERVRHAEDETVEWWEDESTVQILRDALLAAFSQIEKDDPRGVVFLRLHFLHGIEKQRLAEVWQRHPSQATHYVKGVLDELRSQTMAYIKAIDPHTLVTWEDVLAVCARDPRLLHGDGTS